MALILKESTGVKQCESCGMAIKGNYVCLPAGSKTLLLHPNCSQHMAKLLLSDLSQLMELGYKMV